ncbi:MAG TPA: hypothetical protein VMT52_10660 [Planctomycetota bacterium]|nr:hypothetical protein [Planctomycetota bacterium]
MSPQRAVLILLSLYLGFSAIDNAWFSIRCRTPVPLVASEMAELLDPDVLWVRVEGASFPVDAVLIASDSGNGSGAWIPIVSPSEPSAVVALVHADSLAAARALRATPGARIEGLSPLAEAKVTRVLLQHFRAAGLRASPGCRVIELGSAPPGLLDPILRLAVAGLLAAAAFLVKSRVRPSRAASDLEEEHPVPPYENMPLDEDERAEVEDMLDEAWKSVSSSNTA